MDSRETHQLQQQQLQPPHGMLLAHNHSYNRNPNAAAFMSPTSMSQAMHNRLPFGSISPHQPQQHQLYPHHHHHLQQQKQQQMDQKTLESIGFDGSPSSAATQQSMRFGIEQHQQEKKKRGRPRKYVPDDNIALGLASTSPILSASNSYGGGGGGGCGDSGGANANSSDPPAKRNRGRPPGSGKKQLDALGGTGGLGFTPHVIEIKTGEDIASKVMAFTQEGPRAICILSATGAVSSAMIRQATNTNGVVQYEGRYEIITLSGSFLNNESNGSVSKAGNLSVALARDDGHVVAGCVAGMLIAGSQVQVIVGSFVQDGKKQKQSVGLALINNPEPASAPANMFGGPGSPRSQGQQSETSDENGANSPLHLGNNNGDNNNNNNSHGLFGNSTLQPMHQMPMYHLWPGNTPQ